MHPWAALPSGLMPVEQWQHTQVFRAAGRLLGPDHVGEVGNDDFHLAHAKAACVDCELSVALSEA
jgi:hypothetical protein